MLRYSCSPDASLPFPPRRSAWSSTMVRGKGANEALDILRFTSKQAAQPVHKLLTSAIANAEENFGVSRDDLIVAH